MPKRSIEAIVVGGSAGALEALGAILPALPKGFAVPTMLVIHLPPERPSHLAEVLATKCSMTVLEAEDKQPIAAATIYIAPPNYHLLVEKKRTLSLSADEPVRFSRPSIDVLFESAADAFGPALVGLLLAGANDDGAAGLARIKGAGGTTIVQSPASSAFRTMPEAAMRVGPADHVLSLAAIGPFLARLSQGAANPEAT